MPGLYAPGHYDLAGFAVGVKEENLNLPKLENISDGDIVLGLSSSGLHSNGFSLVRKIVERLGLKYSDPCPYKPEVTLGKLHKIQ